MINEKPAASKSPETGNPSSNSVSIKGSTRRRFLGQVGAALTGGVVLGKAAVASAQYTTPTIGDGITPPPGVTDERVLRSFLLRVEAATREALIPIPPHTTNGDEERYQDKSGSYSKGLLQDGIGLVNLEAYASYKTALKSGKFEDFENIIIGGTRTQNGPLGAYAFALEGTDDVQFGDAPSPDNQINPIVVPPAPALASEAYG